MSQTPTVHGRANSSETPPSEPSAVSVTNAHLSEIVEALQAVRNGYVQIIVQDGRIVQIDRMEKRRLR